MTFSNFKYVHWEFPLNRKTRFALNCAYLIAKLGMRGVDKASKLCEDAKAKGREHGQELGKFLNDLGQNNKTS